MKVDKSTRVSWPDTWLGDPRPCAHVWPKWPGHNFFWDSLSAGSQCEISKPIGEVLKGATVILGA